jgi:hypothetical protein
MIVTEVPIVLAVGLSGNEAHVLKIPLGTRTSSTSYRTLSRLNSGRVQEMVADVAVGDGGTITGALEPEKYAAPLLIMQNESVYIIHVTLERGQAIHTI